MLASSVSRNSTIVPGCEAEESAAVLVSQFGELTDPLGPHEPRGSRPDREELVAGLADVNHDARPHHFMVLPLPIVLFDHRRQKPRIVRRADVSSSFRCHCMVLPKVFLLSQFHENDRRVSPIRRRRRRRRRPSS